MRLLEFDNYHILERALSVAWHPNLIKVNMCIIHRYSNTVVTSTYRPHKIHPSDSMIHCTIPLRADDMRSKVFEDPVAVRDDINRIWIYDLKRSWLNVCVYHNTGFGWHFHIQVHDNTKRREVIADESDC